MLTLSTSPCMLPDMMKNTIEETATYHHGNLRHRLIEVALEAIEEAGAAELTLRGIAKRAGVSHSAPYRHFPDKEALLVAVAREGVALMLSEIKLRLERAKGDPLARFMVCGLAYIDFAIAHPAHFRVMFVSPRMGVSVPEDLKPESTPFFHLFIDEITECWKLGLLKGESPHAIALSAWSIVHGFSLLVIDGHLQGGVLDEGSRESMKRGLLYAFYSGARGENGPEVVPPAPRG
ncbi:tetracycline transcriptional regulator tetr-related c-terminal [Desulfoluna butyratoxydans]|uniref:Tetracycline transcriptional regulator tetr-related c-terminal n=2 Tax=Desulfoluna butyratoxydans TaxID=231438 RepID=A0A4U8YMD9_9BACT|nr:tetracycline transcriptional regulator tetr-related c-terminal [Desulfoluna butyratoxydans]